MEFTGPSEKVEELYSNNSNEDMHEYLDDTYKPFFNEKSYEHFKGKRYFWMFITHAYLNGYELKPLEINIEKDQDNNAYSFEVDVEYSKGEETNSTTVMGRINFDGNGKFSRVRYSDKGGLIEEMKKSDRSGSSSSEASPEEAQDNSGESESKQNIRAALETVFNGPNEKLDKALDGMENKGFESEEYKKHFSNFSEYFKEHYKPYVSEGFYEASFINTPDASYFLETAHPDNQLKTEGIFIKEKDGYYKFLVEVSFTNNQSGDSKTLEVRGHAQTNEEGKVSSINYINPNELIEELKQ
ncbi:hypothetical protein [Halobacillus sp. K22]|uniref:hypothetical protein n=1 Tax=Halobacillus sp. K22 TaxID=3457431 RepID=UPI003FCD248B